MLAVVLVRTAWVADDAFITFRTADNFVHGYGLRWNTDERVQTYTHPLWMGVFTAAYAVTREPYYTALALNGLLTVGTVVLVVWRVAATPWNALAFLAIVLSSKAFVDFSTSGLENALTHFLIALFLWRWWYARPGRSRALQLTLLATACCLNRLDLVLLVAPIVGLELTRARRGDRWVFAAGVTPLVAWELFSIVYYGFLFPNTAYAKLHTGISAVTLLIRGAIYPIATGLSDPVTILAIAAITIALVTTETWRDDANRPSADAYAAATGVVLYGLYVTRVGGDFMFGRFYTPLLVWTATLFAIAPFRQPRRAGAAIALAALLVGLAAPDEPALLSGYGSPTERREERGERIRRWWFREAFDERRVYYWATGLLRQRRGHVAPGHPWVETGLEWRRSGTPVVVFPTIGIAGFFAGPTVHIIDPYALADPLLARLPSKPKFRIGHYERALPDGYERTVASGVNVIRDPAIAARYDRLHLIVSGPLWSRARWSAILRENLE